MRSGVGGRGTLWGSGEMRESWKGGALFTGGILRVGGALGGSWEGDGYLFGGAKGGLGGTVRSCVAGRAWWDLGRMRETWGGWEPIGNISVLRFRGPLWGLGQEGEASVGCGDLREDHGSKARPPEGSGV